VSAVLLAVALLARTGALPASQNQGQNQDVFPYHVDLDPNFRLSWTFNSSHITFSTNVTTTGYVALGISPNGKMYPADVVVGGVKDGRPYFQDYHTTGHSPPVPDSHQDWTLLSADEVDDVTTMTFTRKLDTCDDEDMAIMEGTTRVIYAYHPNDIGAAGTGMSYHGATRRGAKSLLLLDPPASDIPETPESKDVVTFDIINRNYTVPADDTTYHCSTFMMPDLGSKHHLIKYEPVLSPESIKNVHHLVIYTCSSNTVITDDMIDRKFLCYEERPTNMATCYSTVLAWAIGGKNYVFPPHVGLPMGSKGEPRFFLMEVHYDNPERRSDIVDNSGIRLHLTPHVRQHDAGILLTATKTGKNMVIPPGGPWLEQGYCAPECIDKAMNQTGVDEIRIFSNFLHSHLLGRGMVARVIREGQELTPLAEDLHYDFDYQEMRMLHNEYVLKKGDSLIVDCHYDATDKSNITWGGLTTRDEMCETWPYYYPRIPLLFCSSNWIYDGRGGPVMEDYVKSLDFTQKATRDSFRQMVQTADQNIQCVYDESKSYGQYGTFYLTEDIQTKRDKLEPTKPYVRPSKCGK